MQLLRTLSLLVLIGLAATPVARAADEKKPETFVIVHGATAGGWEWKEVAKLLTADGNTVYRATLTGLGERTHLASKDVDLDTHVDDVVNLILFEDLHDVVLAGHSYGGAVITGVMDRIPERISRVIFLDAVVPENGESVFDVVGGLPPGAREENGIAFFPGYNPNAPLPHGVPQPVKTFSEPVSYKNPRALALPVTYVSFVPAGTKLEDNKLGAKSRERAAARGWTMRTVEGPHVAHMTNPKGVVAAMEESANDRNKPAAPAAAK